MLKLLGEIVRPCLERYLVAMAYLRQQTSPLPDKATLIERLQHYIQGLAVLAEFNAPEFFDKKLIETLITASEQLGWLHWQTNGAVTLTPPGEQAYDHLKRIVGASLIPLLNL
jgi:glycerol-3-phosphate O-acyltransferase